ncbi:MAG: low molecular weight phosphotyrosine protein phosphatase [Ruminococcaceae bacterium]|nr:low molecular weight phosphotyrosine protein phosphatase [Oscillospiraceae bacterium]
MKKIMFVCHGNICRSPMAEFIFRNMLKKRGKESEFCVSSGATSSEEIRNGVGNPVYPPAKAELARHGISCEGKRAYQVKSGDYGKYDLFVVMDSANYRNMMRLFSNDSDKKLRKLMSYAGKDRDVADPWYSNDFEKAYNDIYEGCAALLDALLTEKDGF